MRTRVLILGNVGQAPYSNNLLPPVRAFERAAEVRLVEPRLMPGFASTGGSAPAEVPHGPVAEAVADFAPDMVVCLAGGTFLAPATRQVLPAAAVMVGIALSDPLGLAASLAIAPEFDLFYTQDPASVPAYEHAGIAVRRCDLAVDLEMFAPAAVEPDCDVVFYGKRTPYREEVLERLAPEVSVRVHGYAWDPGWRVPTGPQLDTPETLAAGICRARVALELAVMDDAPPPFTGRWRITPRPFIAAACGVPSLIEASPTLSEFFAPGEEIATFGAPDDVAAAALALLGDERRRLEMGRAARRRAAACHTWDQRVAAVLADADRFRRRQA